MSTSAAPAFVAVRVEGGLLSADLLASLADPRGDLPGLRPDDYHLLPGTRLGDEIARSWRRLADAWQEFAERRAAFPSADPATEQTRDRWLLPLFAELGYGRLQPSPPVTIASDRYPVSHRWGSVPVHLVGSGVSLDHRVPGVRGTAGSSPYGLVQQLLNRSEEMLWGMVSNGVQLRILRDDASLTRQSFVEFDLERIFADEAYVDFVAFWLACHQSRVEGDPTTCWLERWQREAEVRGTRVLDALRDGVESSIVALGRGFLSYPANQALRDDLRSGRLDRNDYFHQLLRLVYRLLFLLVAEDRDLLHPPGVPDEVCERYARWYGVGRLRGLAERSRGGPHADLWQGLGVVLRSLGGEVSDAPILPALGLPWLGSFLWSERATPALDGARLANRDLLAAIRALAFTAAGSVRRAVDFRNLGAEELGSVYESLLEQHPQVDVAARTFDRMFDLGTTPGHDRKTTGSYYTPGSLVANILDSALDPVMDEAARSTDPEGALLALRILDPACGSGHFLVAAAHRLARRLASIRTGDYEPAPEAVRRALREVVGHCLFGVDVHPMAVELCKVGLWLEAVEPGLPLAFLDGHVVCGNSLLGTTPSLLDAGIPDEACKLLEGDDREVAASWRQANRQEREGGQQTLALSAPTGQVLADLRRRAEAVEEIPDEEPHNLRLKEQQWAAYQDSAELRRQELAASAWCAAFVAPKVPGAPRITTGFLRQVQDLSPREVDDEARSAVLDLAHEYGFFQFHLAFPQVFRDPEPGEPVGPYGWAASGGFDVVLGNPPWEKVQFKEQEFFAERVPSIAAAVGANRKRLIADLAKPEEDGGDPVMYDAYRLALRWADGESHLLRSSGRFPLAGRGQINTYAVFAELMRSLLAPDGRCGMVVPTGIATDDTTKYLFADVVERRSLVSLYDFENREGIFPDVDSRQKFSLLTLSGFARPVEQAEFAFFCHSTDDLADPDRRFVLAPEDLALVNPNTRTCPVFRSRRDAELTLGVYRRIPVLVNDGPDGANPWTVSLRQGLFNMTSDSALFRTAADCEDAGAVLDGNVYRHPDGRTWLPLYEGKMVHHFDHRFAGAKAHGDVTDLSPAAKVDPAAVPLPRYWVNAAEVDKRLLEARQWLLGFRDICRSTDERTVITMVVPRSAVGNKLPLLFSDASSPQFALMCAVLSSFAFDFVARQKIGGASLNFFIVKQLPVLPPDTFVQPAPWDSDHSLAEWLTPRVLELTYTAWDLAGFAEDLGWDGPPFRWDDERRILLRAELDACFFHLYGFDRDDIAYIMDTFPIVRRKDEAAHGEYRTARLILESYDAMAKAADTGDSYQTVLTPPPADPSVAHSVRPSGRPLAPRSARE